MVWIGALMVSDDASDAFVVDADGVVRGCGMTSLGIEEGGSKSSVYISSKILESPMIAAGWSAKCVSADSKCA